MAERIAHEIDRALQIGDRATRRKLRARIAQARALIEYIHVHHLDQLERDLEERIRDGAP